MLLDNCCPSLVSCQAGGFGMLPFLGAFIFFGQALSNLDKCLDSLSSDLTRKGKDCSE